MTNQITIIRPDDWHLHLRDGDMLGGIAKESARDFGRAIIMPNLVPPVVTSAQAQAYRQRILEALPKSSHFTPLMTLYLTENTQIDDLKHAHSTGVATAVKLYPAGATTNSDSGVRDFDKIIPALETMADIGMPLCVHGEVSDPEVDIFDREAVFIERILDPLRRRVPSLKVVMEHVTTAQGVAYAASAPGQLAATLTVHHLIINRNHLLAGGIRPHYYCLPVAKRENHRQAVLEAATSGKACFFLGTDSAPHRDCAKENACGCAGIFTASNAIACLAEVFERQNALDKLEGFTSRHGAAFYGLPPNDDHITLIKGSAVKFPAKIDTKAGPVTVFDPIMDVHWHVAPVATT